MHKLSDYVAFAVSEYIAETGNVDLDARWIAEFFQDSGIRDDFPILDLVSFAALVQKALNKEAESAAKQTRAQLERVMQLARQQRKP
jgi:hypothetical protein